MEKKFIVNTSARHIHVSQADLEVLFGKGFELSVRKMLIQPGQFASSERVTVLGAEKDGVRKEIKNISILGPVRKASQVEVSFTDARSLGLTPPIRESGDLAGSAPCTLVGPAGSVDLSEGVIVAKRHVHFSPDEAKEFGVEDKQIIKVRLDTPGRALIFDDVVARVSPSYSLEMHIDTDEANAAAASGEVFGTIVK